MSKMSVNRGSQLRSRNSFARNFWRVMLQMIIWSGFAVLYYLTFSLLYDTPYEYYMRLSSNRLRSEYTALESRLDSLNVVIADIERRDASLFKQLFESTPYTLEEDYESHSATLRESLSTLSTDELYSLYEQRCEGFNNSVESLVESTHTMISEIERVGSATSKIPAIQPISNRHLTLLTASFGERIHPFYKTMQHHPGVDYTIPEGSRVFATADGVVKSVSLSNSPSGKSIVIDHGNGYESYYAHLGRVNLPARRRVKRGDIIGASGNTGLSLTPHLHYEVRRDGVAIDPINYFFMELNAQQSRRIAKIAESGMQAFD